jgi:hypothetical protein
LAWQATDGTFSELEGDHMKCNKKTLIASTLACALGAVAPVAPAAPITVAFPSSSSTINANVGFFFLDTHFVQEAFTGTGLASIDSLDLHLIVATNQLNNGGHVDFDVLVNGVDVGDIIFVQADGAGPKDFSFGFASIAGAGDYTLRLDVKNNVPTGLGSVSFGLTGSTATLESAVAVPVPATLGLLGLGLGLLFSVRRRV